MGDPFLEVPRISLELWTLRPRNIVQINYFKVTFGGCLTSDMTWLLLQKSYTSSSAVCPTVLRGF